MDDEMQFEDYLDDEIGIEDLSADEIAELLADEGHALTEAQAAELRDFIERVGGLENAFQAVQMLSELEKAA
jgi:hypothetical protein